MSNAISYKELGLVNTREMFRKAMEGRYAIPAYNFNNLEQLQAVLLGCAESKSPVILQVSSGARKYANQTMLRYMAMGGIEMLKEMGAEIPVALHLDHGDSFELARSCIDSGFSSVMIDQSHLPFDENIEVCKQVVKYAHERDVTVEGELGVLAGIEDEVQHEVSTYTQPEEVEEFVARSGVDSLAISIGTSHGAYKFKCVDGELPPPLRFDILEAIEKLIPGFPIVLHGASSVVPEYVQMINDNGGLLEGAMGVSEDQLRRAATSSVCKVNIDSDGRLVVTGVIRREMKAKPSNFDPRKYLGPAREELKQLIIHKNTNVLGSAGHA